MSFQGYWEKFPYAFFLIISHELIHLNTLGEAMITQSPELEAPDTRDWIVARCLWGRLVNAGFSDIQTEIRGDRNDRWFSFFGNGLFNCTKFGFLDPPVFHP